MGPSPYRRLNNPESLGALVERLRESIVNRLRAEGPDAAPVPISIGWAVRAGDERLEKTVGRADRDLMNWRAEVRSGAGACPFLRA